MPSLVQYIEMNLRPRIIIEPLKHEHNQIKELLDLKWPLFDKAYEGEKLRHHKYFLGNLDEDTVANSVIARNQETNKIMGAYIISKVEFEADPKQDLYDLKWLNGHDVYEGISLFVAKEYQGFGVGKQLMAYLIDKANKENIPIVGSHYYTLHNIKDWLKRRYLYRDDAKEGTYYTIYTGTKKLKPSKLGKEYFKQHPDFFK
jgi:GNAT superfamily N-acetyltransferase